MAKLPDEIASLKVENARDASDIKTLSELWQDGPTVLVFLRR